MARDSQKISVVIPAHPDDLKSAEALKARLESAVFEVIISTEQSRAKSLNAGAKTAQGDILLFLHADSEIQEGSLDVIQNALSKDPNALFYFDLRFHTKDAPFGMGLNAWGANIRSRLLGLPFGDQGLCITKTLFGELGDFDETVTYGEDHVFVWRAKKRGVKIRPLKKTIITSARKYKNHGYMRITFRHQYLWFKQLLWLWRNG